MHTEIENSHEQSDLAIARGVDAPGLPDPVFPRYPEKYGDVEPDPKFRPTDGNPYRTRVTVPMIARALRGWLVKPGNFHPLISYLFTDWKYNLDCHMTEATARPSIDWLHGMGCRVPALMGGEVLDRLGDAGVATFKQAAHGFQGTPGSIAE